MRTEDSLALFDRLAALSPAREAHFVPGTEERSSHSPRPPFQEQALSQQLLCFAEEDASHLARAQAYLVASEFLQHEGQQEAALQATRSALEAAPQLAVGALQARRLAPAQDELLPRSWEAVSRWGQHPSTRLHALLLLAQHLLTQGQPEQALKVLDHGARQGLSDPRLHLERILLTLNPQTEVELSLLPDTLAEALQAVQSYFGHSAQQPDFLALLRASRALTANKPQQAAEHLQELPPSPFLLYLRAHLFASRAETKELAFSLLAELVEQTDSPFIYRTQVRWALEEQDQETLLTLFKHKHFPLAFSLLERLTLLRLYQQELQLSPEEEAELFEQSPSLALSLLPERFWPSVEASSELGAARLGFSLAQSESPQPLLELLQTQPGVPGEELLLQLLRLDLSQGQAAPEQSAQALSALRELPAFSNWEQQELTWLQAVLLEQAELREPALPLYESLREDPTLQSSARRALLALDPTRSAAQEWAEFPSSSPEHKADLLLELALQSPLEDQLELLRSAASAWPDGLLEPALALLRQHTDPDAGAAPPLLTNHTLKHLFFLQAQLHSRDPERAPFSLTPLPEDPSWRWLAAWSHPRSLEELSELGLGDSLWLRWQSGLHSWMRGQLAPSYEAWSTLPAQFGEAWFRPLFAWVAEQQGQTTELHHNWLTQRKSSDPLVRRFAYERLAEFDQARGNHSHALLWKRAQYEEFPEDLQSLLDLQQALLQEGAIEEWAALREQWLQVLPDPDRAQYALWVGATALAQFHFQAAGRHFALHASAQASPSLLALRARQLQAIEQREDEQLSELLPLLLAASERPLDRSSLLFEQATTSLRLGAVETARQAAQENLALRPEHFSTHLLLTRSFLTAPPEEQAPRRQALAQVTSSPELRIALWVQAGELYREAGQNAAAIPCFQEALQLNPAQEGAFHALTELWEEAGELSALSRLLEQRLELELSKEERWELELRLAELALVQDELSKAQAAWEAALELRPQDLPTLRQHAALSLRLQDHSSAERSLLQLRELLPPNEEKLQLLHSLAELYQSALPSTEKSLPIYEELVSLDPEDRQSAARLVELYAEHALPEKATQLQTRLVQTASSEDEKRSAVLRLAELYEQERQDIERAAATLERAYLAWPLQAEVLEAWALFLDRQDRQAAKQTLLSRSERELLRALFEQRLDPALLDTLGRVARLAQDEGQAEAAQAVRAAVLGEESPLSPAGERILTPECDELYAPPSLTESIRHLLQKTGAALDTAFSVDLGSLGAQRAHQEAAGIRLAQIAATLGDRTPEIFLAPSLGARCLPVSLSPLRFVIGAELSRLPSAARDYHLFRAYKLQRLGAGALARSRPEESPILFAALLQVFAPHWQPAGIDAKKLLQARTLIEQGLGRVGYDKDVPPLALEAIGALGNRLEDLGNSAKRMASHAALLATGNPTDSLLALASSQEQPLPPSGPARLRWIENHPEAKELLRFALSSAFLQVRERLKLSPPRPERSAASLPQMPAPPRKFPVPPKPPS